MSYGPGMRKVLWAVVAKNGVIGATTTPCTNCCGPGGVPLPIAYATGQLCSVCGDTRRVRAYGRPWGTIYRKVESHIESRMRGDAIVCGAHEATRLRLNQNYGAMGAHSACIVASKYAGYPRPQVSRTGAWIAGSVRHAIGVLESRGADESGIAYAHRMSARQIHFLGGAQLFAEAVTLVDEMHLFFINHAWPGDVYFPAWEAGFVVQLGSMACMGQLSEHCLPRWLCINLYENKELGVWETSWRRQ